MGQNNPQSLNYYEGRILELINELEGFKQKILDVILRQPAEIEPPDKNVATVLHGMGTVINFAKVPAMSLPDTFERNFAVPLTLKSMEEMTHTVIKQQAAFVKKHGIPARRKAEDVKPVDIDELFINLSKKANDDNGKDS